MEKKRLSMLSMLLEATEHKRLESALKAFATEHEFVREVTFKNGMNPDVLLMKGSNLLFLGDAKDSQNESPSNQETADRIYGYIKTFTDCIRSNEIDGGCIAIATNDLSSAKDWKVWLNRVCMQCGLQNPNFKIKTSTANTHIVFW